MDLRSFGTSSMVAVSAPWVNESDDRPLLASIPMIAPLLPELARIHNILITIHVTTSERMVERQALAKAGNALDFIHDGLYRGIYNMMTAAAELAADEQRRADILGMRNTLFPDGPQGILSSYLAEAGNTTRMAARLTPRIRGFLDSVRIGEETLSEKVDQLIATGDELGRTERRKAQLDGNKDDTATTKTDILNARRRWIKVVQTLIDLLDLAPNITDDIRNRILQPLLREEEKLSRKQRGVGDSEDDADIAAALETAIAEDADAAEADDTGTGV